MAALLRRVATVLARRRAPESWCAYRAIGHVKLEVDQYRRLANPELYTRNDLDGTFRASRPQEKIGTEQLVLMRQLKNITDANDWQGALGVLERIGEARGEEWNPVYRAILHCCCKANQVEEAMRVWSRMPNHDVMGYNMMINLFGRLGRISEADQFFDQMVAEGVKPTGVTHISLMKGMVVKGLHEEAVRELGRLVENEELHSTTNFNVAYLLAMTTCARAGRYQDARRLFDEMIGRGLRPEVKHFNALLTGAAVAPDVDLARSIWEEMKASGLQPRTQDYTILISCHRNDVQEGLRLFEELKQKGLVPSEDTFASLTESALIARDESSIRRIFEEVQAAGYDLDSPRSPRLARKIGMAHHLLAAPHVQDSSSALPLGWDSAVDPGSGQTYYWRRDDPQGSTTWQRPSM